MSQCQGFREISVQILHIFNSVLMNFCDIFPSKPDLSLLEFLFEGRNVKSDYITYDLNREHVALLKVMKVEGLAISYDMEICSPQEPQLC